MQNTFLEKHLWVTTSVYMEVNTADASRHSLVQSYHRKTRARCKIISKSIIKTPERQNKQHRFGVLIVNFEQISDLVLVHFVKKQDQSRFFFFKIGTSHVLASDWLFFVDFLLSRDEEYLKRRQAVKYLRNLRVLILQFYPIFHTLLFDFEHVNVDFFKF